MANDESFNEEIAHEWKVDKGTSVAEKGLESQGPSPILEIKVDRLRENDTYEVQGEDIREVAKFLKLRYEEGAGIIDYNLNSEFERGDEGNVKKVTLRVTCTITMPEWPNLAQQEQDVRDIWDSFWNNLLCHENTHVSICDDHVLRLVSDLRATSEREEAHLKARIKAAWDYHLNEQIAFDLVSKHGTIDYGFCKAATLPE